MLFRYLFIVQYNNNPSKGFYSIRTSNKDTIKK